MLNKGVDIGILKRIFLRPVSTALTTILLSTHLFEGIGMFIYMLKPSINSVLTTILLSAPN